MTTPGGKPVAFVTGAAQGIGLASAARLARDGFRVVAMDRSATALEDAPSFASVFTFFTATVVGPLVVRKGFNFSSFLAPNPFTLARIP